jgi:hypothetical protein
MYVIATIFGWSWSNNVQELHTRASFVRGKFASEATQEPSCTPRARSVSKDVVQISGLSFRRWQTRIILFQDASFREGKEYLHRGVLLCESI